MIAVCEEHGKEYVPGEGCSVCVAAYTEAPVQNEEGTWDALTSGGYGHTLGYPTSEMVEVWIDGYDTGASENM